MANLYCYQCRVELGHVPAPLSGPLLKSGWQRDKHDKHTRVDPSEDLQSVFADPSTSAIRPEVEAALSEGPVEIDYRGRVNYLTLSGDGIGFRYESGVLIESQNLTKVVKSSNASERHQFTESTDRLGPTLCSKCGRGIFDAGKAK